MSHYCFSHHVARTTAHNADPSWFPFAVWPREPAPLSIRVKRIGYQAPSRNFPKKR